MQQAIRNPYFKASWICAALGVFFASIGGSAIVFLSLNQGIHKTQEGFIAIPFFSFPIAIGLFFSSLLAWLMSRRVNRVIGLIRNKEYLAHWSYRPEEWDAFQNSESPLLRRDYRNLAATFLIGLPLGLLFLIVMVFSSNDPDIRGLLIAGIGTCAFFVFVLVGAYYFRVVRRSAWGRAQRGSPPDSYLHTDFVYANGEFVFGIFNQQLIDANLLSGPHPTIEFTIRGSAPRGGEIIEVRRVLVPDGMQKQASEIVMAIRAAWHLD